MLTEENISNTEKTLKHEIEYAYSRCVRGAINKKIACRKVPYWFGDELTMKESERACVVFYFCLKIENHAKVYQKTIIKPISKAPKSNLLNGRDWTVQYGSINAHNEKDDPVVVKRMCRISVNKIGLPKVWIKIQYTINRGLTVLGGKGTSSTVS
ncbi:hypothetical protein TNCV_2020561 [Trichonephila clavipes]|nr:hypothetical protein TNCV_2020561 [Trichonephila clavipes]